ncbi:hypothetical protein EJ08DRAFT_405202 [Tothia fuscella]|uniref:Rhodopsin domain-containing protein n=1 Tax=Tothia fuscella TaxID=1048955 RepID=A0A9P4NK19_9PEZI|nr:hypothetical protein EJ08DRAFT_405202 [Tothia fuscella]
MILFQKEHAIGAMKEHAVPSREIKKYAFPTVLLYHTAVYFTKFSILAFYAKLFPETARGLRFACKFTIAYTALCYFCAIFLTIFWCGAQVSRNFETGPGACTVWSYTLFKINFALNISSDLLIFVLPFPLLSSLNLARRQVIALCVTFGLGLITMVVSVCRCMALLSNAFIPLYVWSMAEMCTAIMVSALPSLRPLLRKSSRQLASSSPTGSNGKRASNAMCKARSSLNNTSPKSCSGSGPGQQKGMQHARHASDDTASDIELIHMKTKGNVSYIEEEQQGREGQLTPTGRNDDSFDPSSLPNRRAGAWV